MFLLFLLVFEGGGGGEKRRQGHGEDRGYLVFVCFSFIGGQVKPVGQVRETCCISNCLHDDFSRTSVCNLPNLCL